jgi:hypothetical protein
MVLKGFILPEKKLILKSCIYMISFIEHSQNEKIIETGNNFWVEYKRIACKSSFVEPSYTVGGNVN